MDVWETCNVVVSSLKNYKNDHPLYLEILPKHAACLGLDCEQKIWTCCLRWRWVNQNWTHDGRSKLLADEISHKKSILVTVKLLSSKNKVNELQDDVAGNIILYATDIFIKHYGFNSMVPIDEFQIKPIECVTLTSVVFYAKTAESYESVLKEEDWKTHLLVKACQQPVLCRRNDVCLAPFRSKLKDKREEIAFLFNLYTLDCQPVAQGIIGPSTSLSILAPSIIQENIVKARSGENHENYANSQKKFSSGEILKFVLIADFTLILLTPFLFRLRDIKLLKRIIKLVGHISKLGMQWKTKLQIQVLVKSPFLSSRELDIDIHNVVFVTSALLKKYNIKDKSWATVWLNPNSVGNNESSKKPRLIKLISIDNFAKEIDLTVFGALNNAIAYISPQLWFNLNTHPSKLVQARAELFVQPMLIDFVADQNFANEIKVALIRTPGSTTIENCDAQLKSYFKIARFIRKGDVICLLSKDKDNTLTLNESVKSKVVYFYVTDLKPESECGLLVDHFKSSLYQANAVSSYIPTSMISYFSINRLHLIFDSPFPVGLDSYSNQLCEIVLPYFQSSRMRKNCIATVCLYGLSGCGKMTLIRAVSSMLNVHLYVVDCWDIIGESPSASEARLKVAVQKVILSAPCFFVLKNVDVLLKDFDGNFGEAVMVYKTLEILQDLKDLDLPVVTIGITNNLNILESELEKLFIHYINVKVPDKSERIKILNVLLSEAILGLDVSVEYLARNTSGYVLGDLVSLVSRAIQAANRRLSNLNKDEEIGLSGVQLLSGDFEEAVNNVQSAQSEAMSAPKIPQVKWEDVGGLEDVKLELLNAVKLPLENPELLSSGLRRSGVLFYGPPGTGKTLLAKAVATEFSLNFISVKGPELLNMYVGQSEENVRKVFQRARDASPSIVFFDEMDSLAPNRGRSGDSGGVMDRVVSQLLAEIDGLSKSADVFVMAATNRPDLLDPALLRPGRFDKLLYVGISEDRVSQLKILKALTRKFAMADDVNLKDIVENCPLQLTGADFYAMCSDALLVAVARKVENAKFDTNEDNFELIVNHNDFMSAIQNLVPSVSPQVLQTYSKIATKISVT